MAGKRAAVATTQASKKARVDRDQRCKAVSDSLEEIDLPKVVRDMLARMAPKSLGIPVGERGPQQTAVVGMLERSLKEHKARMQTTLAGLEEKRGTSEQEQANRDEALKAAESTLAARQSVVEEKKDSLAEVTLEVRAAKKELATAEDAKGAGEVGLKAAEQEKAELERLRNESYTPLKAGTCGSPADIKQCQAGIMMLAELLTVPASLKTALPGVLAKPAADRGTFDVMVTDQFDAELVRRVAALDETLANAAPVAAERVAAVAAAEAALRANKDRQRAAAQAQRESESGEEGTAASMAALQAAKREVTDFARKMAVVERQLAQQQRELEAFKDGVLAPFQELRDPPAEPPADEAADEEPAAEEPAAEDPAAEEPQDDGAAAEDAAVAAA